ncbi:MAG: hypothetical protein PHY44_04675 [Lachnospiraceae bacterium]|nr:hypothetical protein [Lachnospiraceae bacterium]
MNFYSFSGTVTSISDFMISSNDYEGCYKIMGVDDIKGRTVNFVISPTTYFIKQEMVLVGDSITGYYDGDAPVPLIYPPQYRALIVVKNSNVRNVKVDYFDCDLVSSDGKLKLNISSNTKITLTNGQDFSKNPAKRNLIVIYGASTRSIPAQTTPSEIIVWCSM